MSGGAIIKLFYIITYQDILDINAWCQNIIADSITPTYGIQDENLLRSIPEAVVQSFDGTELYPTAYEKCSHLWYSLSQYHCFADGNKRTALTSTIVLLMRNGLHFETNAGDLYEICIHLASGKLNRKEICEYLMTHTTTDGDKGVHSSASVAGILDYLGKDAAFVDVLNRLGH